MTTVERILEAVHWAMSRGISIRDCDWGVRYDTFDNTFRVSNGSVCPMSAAILHAQARGRKLGEAEKCFCGQPYCSEVDMGKLAAQVLGVSSVWVRGFVTGFDGKAAADDHSGHAEGAAFRQMLYNGKFAPRPLAAGVVVHP